MNYNINCNRFELKQPFSARQHVSTFAVQAFRVQASRLPVVDSQSKRLVVQSPSVRSPSVQTSRAQASSHPEPKRPESKLPESKHPGIQSPSVETMRPDSSFSGMSLNILFSVFKIFQIFFVNI